MQYLGIVCVPPLWLSLTVQYTGREHWLSRRNLALLAIIPLLTLALVWTNEMHGLIWKQVGQALLAPHRARSHLRPILLGPLGVFLPAPSHRQPAGNAGPRHIAGTLPRAGGRSIGGSTHSLAGESALRKWIESISGVGPDAFLIHPVGPRSLGRPSSFPPSGHRSGGTQCVIESMDDAMLVLDVQGRVIDLNPAASQVIGRPRGLLLGQPADQVLPPR